MAEVRAGLIMAFAAAGSMVQSQCGARLPVPGDWFYPWITVESPYPLIYLVYHWLIQLLECEIGTKRASCSLYIPVLSGSYAGLARLRTLYLLQVLDYI